jgi:endonuclease/exonuclease/phosphatase (EEP) superfamily protein YafD
LQLRATAEWVRGLQQPVGILGDLNTTGWSHEYRRFVSKARIRSARDKFGVHPTWRSKLPLLLMPIDHILFNEPLQALHTKTGAIPGSDHRYILAKLRLG